MGIHGDLKSLGVLELFSMLNQCRKTGVLSLITESCERGFLFHEGNLVCATASDERRRLGNFLVRLGFLSIDEINEAGRLSQYSPGHFGQQLMESGVITANQLRIAVKAQIFSILNEVIGWVEASFFFDDTDTLTAPKRGVVATPSFILEVAKRSDDYQFAKQIFPETNLVLGIEKGLESYEIDEDYKDVLFLVNGTNSIEQVLFLSPQPPRQTVLKLKKLWDMGIICRVGVKVNSLDRLVIPDIYYTAVAPDTPAKVFGSFSRNSKKQHSEVSDIISQEPLLAAKILKLLSLSNIELTRSDINMERLTHLLGGFQTRCILLPEAVRNLYFPRNDLYWRESWEHDRICAALCRKIAEEINYPFPDEAYMAGLVHNLGVYIFLTNNAKDYRWLVTESFARKKDIVELEESYYSISHMKIGGIYARKWKFPQLFRMAITEHHKIESGIVKPLLHILFLAEASARKNGFKIGYQETDYGQLKQSMQFLSITEEMVDSFSVEVQNKILSRELNRVLV